MDILQALYTELNNTVSITSLTSSRIFPEVAQSGIGKPYITYYLISDVPTHAMKKDAPISQYRIQISSWSTAFSQMSSVASAVKTTLRDKTGSFGTSDFTIQRIFYDSQSNFPEVNPETKSVMYHRAQDFIIWTTC